MKSAPTIASLKIRMMKDSMECFTFGLLAWVPVIGVVFALMAFLASFQAGLKEKHLWNPAKPQRTVGLVSALLGGLVWSMVDTVMIAHIFFNPVH